MDSKIDEFKKKYGLETASELSEATLSEDVFSETSDDEETPSKKGNKRTCVEKDSTTELGHARC